MTDAGIPPADHFEAADIQIEDFNNLLTRLTTGPDALLGAKVVIHTLVTSTCACTTIKLSCTNA